MVRETAWPRLERQHRVSLCATMQESCLECESLKSAEPKKFGLLD